jgi:hypothetical protein
MNVWFWILVIVFGLYYTFPDSLKWTSFISSRLGLLVYIFAVLWICGLNFPRRSGFIIPIAILLITIPLYGKYLQSVRSLSVEANSCYDAQEFIRPNSTVLPLNYPGNWFAAHFSNYLGAEKPVAVLENYECGLDYFPLRWNMDRIPNTLLGETSCYDIPCAYWVFDSSHVAMKIDYVFVLGDQVASADSCHRELRKTILDGYNLVNRTEHYELFERK